MSFPIISRKPSKLSLSDVGQILAFRNLRRMVVQIDRNFEAPSPILRANRSASLLRFFYRNSGDGNERDDVDRTHAWMFPFVLGQVDESLGGGLPAT